jgi:hypothetical protein
MSAVVGSRAACSVGFDDAACARRHGEVRVALPILANQPAPQWIAFMMVYASAMPNSTLIACRARETGGVVE